MKTRKPAVAGQFYPDSRKEIGKLYETILLSEKPKIDYSLAKQEIIGAIVPHAGFMYSGYEAIHFFEILKFHQAKFDTIIIINPSHTGYGTEIDLDANDCWETPMGKVHIDREFMDALPFPKSEIAHRFEHSGEIMVPFLQYVLDYAFQILPLTLSKQTYNTAQTLADSLIKANKKLGKHILMIASSDFSHHLKPETGKYFDDFVIRGILAQDARAIEKEVNDKNISVCGFGPIMSLIEYSKGLSLDFQIKLLRYGHSGEVFPSGTVVDYACFLFYR